MDPIISNIGFLASIDTHLTEGLAHLGAWLYVVLWAVVFAETGLVFFPFLPGDSLLFAAGTLAASNEAHLGSVLLVLWLGAVLGNNSNYWIGRWMGKRVFKWGDSRFFNRKTFDRTHAFYRKHGGKTIILARFIPFARTFAPFVAGVVQMDYIHFVVKDLIGATLWVFSLTLSGYWFGKLTIVKDNLGLIFFTLLVFSLVPIFVALWKMKFRRQSPEN